LFRYECGAARQFKDKDGIHQVSHIMTCLWDRNWTNTNVLNECDWVQCLKPATPPSWSNLKISNWNGKPYEFDTYAVYVCKRGYYYLKNVNIKSFQYKCESGSDSKFKRGFFSAPQEPDWPRCVRGMNIKYKSNLDA